jgi:hypothetical protein
MLQNLSGEIRECLHRAEECRRLSKTALTASAIEDYLNMEHHWLTLARSYEFSERLSSFTDYRRKARDDKETPGVWARIVGDKVMMQADVKRLHKYMLEVEHIDHISDEMRAVVESEWPELAHKLPPKKPRA